MVLELEARLMYTKGRSCHLTTLKLSAILVRRDDNAFSQWPMARSAQESGWKSLVGNIGFVLREGKKLDQICWLEKDILEARRLAWSKP